MKPGSKYTLVLILGVLIIGVVTTRSYRDIRQLTQTNQSVIRTHRVMESLGDILSVLKDAETGQRGFILTGEDQYLEPFNAALGEIQKKIASTIILTEDDPEQQRNLHKLQELTRAKLDELQETIQLRRKGGIEAAIPMIHTDRDKKIMDEIRVLMARMLALERDLLDLRNRATDELARRNVMSLCLSVFLSLIIFMIAAVIVMRTIRSEDVTATTGGFGETWQRTVVRYAFAAVMVVLTTGARWWLEKKFGPMPLFLTWYPGIFLVASIAGGGPGLVFTFLSALAADYWFIMPFGFGILAENDLVALGIFIGSGIFVSALIEYYRRIQKRSIETTKLANNYNRSLLEASLDPLVTISAGGKITDVNEAAIKATGLSRGDLVGTDFSNYFTEPVKAKAGYLEVFSKGFVADYPLTLRHKDGHLMDVLYNASVYKDTQGNVLGVFAAARDVTLLKQASQYARSLIESSLDPLVTISADGKITDVNEATIKATGLSRGDLVGTDFSDYFTEPEKAKAGYQEVFSKGFVTGYPLTIRRKDGNLTDVLYNASVYKDTHGNALGVFAAARDVTELKKAEAELRRHRDSLEVLVAERTSDLAATNKELASSNENLEQFAYVASHDLQEPLRVMSSYSQLLEKRYKNKLDQDANEFIDFIVDAAKRMQKLITDLLAYSRIGKKDIAAAEEDLNPLVQKVLDGMATVLESSAGTVTYDKLPVITVHETSMMQIFQNLIGNALKFHGKAPPKVHISARKDAGEWVFSVRDNGLGIEPQYHERIFQIFQRLHSREEYSGTGIGLSICKKIVTNNGGRIWVESEYGKGSIFYFTLPA